MTAPIDRWTGKPLCWQPSSRVAGHFCHLMKGHNPDHNHLMMTVGPPAEYSPDQVDEAPERVDQVEELPKLSHAQAIILFQTEEHRDHKNRVAGARKQAAARLVALGLATIAKEDDHWVLELLPAGVELARRLRPPETRFRRND